MAIIKVRNPAIDLDAAEIPNLPASKITSGTLDNARISLDAAEIPNLDTAKITTGTFATAKLADSSVTTAKLNDSAVTTAKLNDASVSLAKLTATGTKDATTFLRGDNTFASAQGKFESQLLHVRDIKIYATDGGSSVVGTQTRDLNTVETNEISGASLSSNQITLPAGTYFIQASAPAYKSGNSKAVLHNVTSGSVNAVGTAEYSDVGDNILTRSFINKRFTITVTSVFEIRHFLGAAKSLNGLGIGYNVASTNVYTEVMIWKVA